jgi:hypothetical protein
MSVVNDALKKAGKEFESNDRNKPASANKKIPVVIPFIFIAIVILLGIFFLRRNAPEITSDNIAGGYDKSGSAIQSTLNNVEQKNTSVKAMKSKNIAKLNGIVYGDEGKWAIVNDEIVKEGDSFLGGEIVSITKDLVKIENKDGTEIVLSLK